MRKGEVGPSVQSTPEVARRYHNERIDKTNKMNISVIGIKCTVGIITLL